MHIQSGIHYGNIHPNFTSKLPERVPEKGSQTFDYWEKFQAQCKQEGKSELLNSLLDKLAKNGKPNYILPKTHFENLDFSFSGIKTAVINLHHKNPNINKADLCASFQKTVTETLMENVKKAIKKTEIKTVALAGGVSANSYIRQEFMNLQEEGIKVYMPDLKLCTDNAAMIASAGYYNYINGKRDNMYLNAIPNLKLDN